MSATKAQKGWTGVQFASTSIAHVQSVMFGKGGSLIEYISDNSIIPTIIAVQQSRPHATIVSADVATLMGFAVGASGSLVATQPDILAAVGGNIAWTLSNGVVANVDETGQWGAVATATMTVQAFSTDGTTSPLAFTLS